MHSEATARPKTAAPRAVARHVERSYPLWFYIPGGLVYVVLFIVPTLLSFYFAFTRWTLFDSTFVGFDNFIQFFAEPGLIGSLKNTLVYGVVTSASKVVLGMLLAVLLSGPIIARGYLRSVTFFPVLVSAVGVGLTFQVLLDPFNGVVNQVWTAITGADGPGWLTNPDLALLSVAAIDVWKGVGLATLIYIAGIAAIPNEYFEAARVDGAGAWQQFRSIILPLSFPATSTVILLSLIGGLRSFDLIWSTTQGGPGFSSDVIASVIYKQYQAGFYGLSTAGNVILFLVVTAIVYPLSRWLNSKETSL
ncbi:MULTISPECIES: carbohydrate ABC transporter permease [Tessaracoccus]|uniref:Sugar ABC transporter permease n=2 Tax=Tessaracoccus TaxID=72763 RepID=A0ABY8PV62_9ACTN|nr:MULTISPECIES: sugar ABC transporter permease [Tessaracoccus]QXT63804.1 sugar ABC transporter permease [Tessaracoccus palaemonis]WGT46342.1 sugar ABC transporter permease [Tessaracoccus sp. T21]